MASLTAIFGNSEGDPGDSDKLLELYKNRAELKKDFDSLRDDTQKLQNQINDQVGETARLQQKLEHLEDLLLDPDLAYSVVAHYQLRAFNLRCISQLALFAEQLKQNSEKQQYGKVFDAWRDERDEEAQAIRAQISEHQTTIQTFKDQFQAEQQRYSSMSGPVRFFRKRAVRKTLDRIATQIEAIREQETELLGQLEAIQSRDAPDTEGLDIASKRSINFMILAFAQQIYVHFFADNLAGLAKESGDKSVGAINYGNKKDCEVILEIVRGRADSMDDVTEFAGILKQRAQLISAAAQFNSEDDAVPVPGSVSTVYEIDRNGVVTEKEANLIGDNYWNVASALSR